MTTFPLPGAEGEIFLRALSDYSDNCSAPALTPGCPFAVDIEPGRRGCGEECKDLLAIYNAPMSLEEVQLGKGVAIRPRVPRARRGPGPQSKPFDAAEMLLADEGSAITSWRSSSLLRFLIDRLSEPPSADPVDRTVRRDGIYGIISELEGRGFDIEAIVRDPGAFIVISSVTLATIIRLLVACSELEIVPLFHDFDTGSVPVVNEDIADDWARRLAGDKLSLADRLDLAREGGPEQVLRSVSESVSRSLALGYALRRGPITDIIDWSPPSDEVHSALEELDTISRWVIDRFTVTYLSQWDDPSLLHEWEWMHGQRLAPCDPGEMHCRSIDGPALDAEIASRKVLGTQVQTRSTPGADRYVRPAVEMLREGRRPAAAAVFEAITRVTPNDREAHNNFGFCLIPDFPERALSELETAARLGMSNDSVNTGNRMLVLSRLGRLTTALEVANRFYDSIGSATAPRKCFMWSFSEVPEVIDVQNSHLYIAELAQELARRAGDTKLAERWHDRANAFLE